MEYAKNAFDTRSEKYTRQMSESPVAARRASVSSTLEELGGEVNEAQAELARLRDRLRPVSRAEDEGGEVLTPKNGTTLPPPPCELAEQIDSLTRSVRGLKMQVVRLIHGLEI